MTTTAEAREPAAVGQPEGDSIDASPEPLLASPRVVIGVLALASIAVALAEKVMWHLGDLLPRAATVPSAIPEFRVAEPFTVRSSAILVAVAVLIGFATSRARVHIRPTPRARVVLLVAVVMAAAALYLYFGYPHNAGVVDSYYHWVDISFARKHVQWYVLMKPLHRAFYDRPYILQSMNGALNVVLMYLIGRTLFRRGLIPVAMATALLISSLILTYADTAEDVQLTVAVLLFVTLAFVRRWTPWTGVALLLVILARPPLICVWFAWIATELFVVERGAREPRLRRLLRDRFVVVNAAVAAGLFTVWDVILVVRGENWLFHNGRVVDNILVTFKPITINGFRISAFSGAYLLHAVWTYPPIWLVGIAVALLRLRHLPVAARRVVVFGVLSTAGGIVVSEAEPLAQYNVRYLAYFLPLIMVGAFTVLLLPQRRVWLGRSAVVTLLLFAGTTTYWTAFTTHRNLVDSAVTETFDARFELRRIVGDAPVSSTIPSTPAKRYLAYIFHRERKRIPRIRPGEPIPKGYVFAIPSQVPPGRVVWRRLRLVLVKVG